MQLSEHGTIKHNGLNIMRTECGRWAISQPSATGSKHIGYVDMLADVDAFLAHRKDTAKARLAQVEAKHAARKAGKCDAIDCEDGNPDAVPNTNRCPACTEARDDYIASANPDLDPTQVRMISDRDNPSYPVS